VAAQAAQARTVELIRPTVVMITAARSHIERRLAARRHPPSPRPNCLVRDVGTHLLELVVERPAIAQDGASSPR